MKRLLSFLAILLLLTACKRQELSADEKMQQMLAGDWIEEHEFTNSVSNISPITIGTDGRFTNTIDMPRRTNGPRTVTVEGTLRVENGFLIATITRNSDTNEVVPVLTAGELFA